MKKLSLCLDCIKEMCLFLRTKLTQGKAAAYRQFILWPHGIVSSSDIIP